jgi:hypothetical protein
MSSSWVFAMDILFNAICVLVIAAFALTFVPGLMLREGPPLSMGDRGRALLVCVVLALVEKRAFCTGGLDQRTNRGGVRGRPAGGPLVGVAMSVFVAWLAVKYDGCPWGR